MICKVPVIETERLILRGRRLSDFPAYAGMWRDPAVVRFISGKPLTREEAWTKFTRMAGCWAINGYGFWTIEEKATGAFIGEAGAADFKRDLEPSLDGKPEFGWGLIPSAQGKGYASEALAAALSWARGNLEAETFCCIISPDNAPSIRVAEKAGFVKSGEAPYHGEPVAIFERSAA